MGIRKLKPRSSMDRGHPMVGMTSWSLSFGAMQYKRSAVRRELRSELGLGRSAEWREWAGPLEDFGVNEVVALQSPRNAQRVCNLIYLTLENEGRFRV